jgi:7-carboxy-7-deazaguanine synthase
MTDIVPMTARAWLLVSETFLTLQGEGPSTGQPAFFIRLGTCNLTCRWCDTAYTWSFTQRQAEQHEKHVKFQPSKELKRRNLSALAYEWQNQGRPRLVVITGGEPLIQLPAVAGLISEINEDPIDNVRFEIETAGTIHPGELNLFTNVHFNVSPKLESSGNEPELRYKPDVLAYFREWTHCTFKFVIETRYGDKARTRDFLEMTDIVHTMQIPHNRVWLMPVATSEEQLVDGLRQLAPLAIANNFNLSTRLHVTIWKDERGH